jgi:hypothetical protein
VSPNPTDIHGFKICFRRGYVDFDPYAYCSSSSSLRVLFTQTIMVKIDSLRVLFIFFFACDFVTTISLIMEDIGACVVMEDIVPFIFFHPFYFHHFPQILGFAISFLFEEYGIRLWRFVFDSACCSILETCFRFCSIDVFCRYV